MKYWVGNLIFTVQFLGLRAKFKKKLKNIFLSPIWGALHGQIAYLFDFRIQTDWQIFQPSAPLSCLYKPHHQKWLSSGNRRDLKLGEYRIKIKKRLSSRMLLLSQDIGLRNSSCIRSFGKLVKISWPAGIVSNSYIFIVNSYVDQHNFRNQATGITHTWITKYSHLFFSGWSIIVSLITTAMFVVIFTRFLSMR